MTIVNAGQLALALGVSRDTVNRLERAEIIRSVVPNARKRIYVLEVARDAILNAARVEGQAHG